MNKKAIAFFSSLFIIPSIIVLSGCSQGAPEPAFDLIIKGGRLYDGTTAGPRIRDIGIKGDKIAAIGNFRGRATKTIDASGLISHPVLSMFILRPIFPEGKRNLAGCRLY